MEEKRKQTGNIYEGEKVKNYFILKGKTRAIDLHWE